MNVIDLDIPTQEIHTRDTDSQTNPVLYDLASVNMYANFKIMDISSLSEDNKNTKYYTGLPTYQALSEFYNLMESSIPHSSRHKLTKSQSLLLTMMKLRLGSDFIDLAYRFNASEHTVSRTFYTMINILYAKLKKFVFKPNRQAIQKNMPEAFKEHFGLQVCSIIDCTEIKTECPKNPAASVQLWSSYKSNHTIKFLISITPQGAIEFVSEAYGGRASDGFITLTSGFLDTLCDGDYVLADKGFTLKNEFSVRGASIEVPTFVYNRNQLHPLEIERTRKCANVRIHVERVIGMVKQKYKILEMLVPLSIAEKHSDEDVAYIDKIMLVCCALCNICGSIIK